MTGRVERADGSRNDAFPASWGIPRGEPSSEERRLWVLSKVRRHVIDRKQDPAERRAQQLARKRRTP